MRELCVIPLVICLGCFKPQIAEVDCSVQRECPPGMVCDVDDVCRLPENRLVDAGIDGPRGATDPDFDVAHLADPVADFGDLELVISGTVTVDTSANIVGAPHNLSLAGIGQAGGGPQTAVLVVKRFEIASGARLVVRGARGLIIVSEEGAVISGTLDASAEGVTPGPGADNRGLGNDGATDGNFHAAGGGGSLLIRGGNGGDTEDAGGGSGGETVTSSTLEDAIIGGAGGGGGARGVSCERDGGGGGGAIQISTPTAIAVTSSGMISAGGGGGEPGGPCPAGRGGPGGGGGSGGVVYLQATSINVDGALIANGGGGGGGGGDDNNQDGDRGEDGSAITMAANGGSGGDDSGDGGRGGGLVGPPEDGEPSRTGNGGGGGGGGAPGLIVIDGEPSVGNAVLISPAPL